MLGEGHKYNEDGHSLEGNKDREDVRQREKSRDLEHQKTFINVCDIIIMSHDETLY